jgi:hypothetical protein
MNAEQRKFLVAKIEGTFKEQKEALEKTIPEQPELNRFMIGAILEGTFKVLPEKQMKEAISLYVKKDLKDEELIKTDSYRGWGRGRDDKEVLRIPPECIFQIPSSFQKELDSYNKKKEEVDAAIFALKSQRDTLVLKIQIGSNQILD